MNKIKLKPNQFEGFTENELLSIEKKWYNLILDQFNRGKISIGKYYDLFNIIYFKVHGYVLSDFDCYSETFKSRYEVELPMPK